MPYKDKSKQQEAQRAYEEKRKGTRHRGWVFLVYPESAPENWRELLEVEQVPCLVSPLHDQDENADGTPKKPHHHVLALWDNPTTYESAKALADLVGGVIPPKNPKPGTPKPWVQSTRAAARYLCHLDNADKAQYSPDQVLQMNGAEFFDIIASAADDDDELDKIFDFIDEHSVVSFAEFVRWCRTNKPEWRRLVYHKYAAIVTRYIKSCAWEAGRESKTDADDLERMRRSVAAEEQERAELNAGNWAMNAVVDALARARDAGTDDPLYL